MRNKNYHKVETILIIIELVFMSYHAYALHKLIKVLSNLPIV